MTRTRSLLVAIALLGVAGPALAQDSGSSRRTPGFERDARRLFQRFVQDAAILPGGWIEGRLAYANLPNGETTLLGPLIAFRLAPSLEAGLRFGFLDVDQNPGVNDSGLSDIEVYLKYRPSRLGRQRLAFGALVKAATADESDGLGTGETDVEIFGAYRANLQAVTLVLNAGIRLNGDPPGSNVENSILFGGGILLPATQRLTFILEGSWETERVDGADDDGRLTTGIQLMGRNGRGGFRAAIALPLTDAAPDYEILVGALFTY